MLMQLHGVTRDIWRLLFVDLMTEETNVRDTKGVKQPFVLISLQGLRVPPTTSSSNLYQVQLHLAIYRNLINEVFHRQGQVFAYPGIYYLRR